MKSVKVALVGDVAVGKTTFMYRLSDRYGDPEPSVGGLYFPYKFSTEKEEIHIDFWDTAGSEKYNSLITQYTRDAKIILFFFAFNDLDSFNNINEWYNILQNIKVDFKAIIIGNKTDLINEDKKADFVMNFDFQYEYAEVSCTTLNNFENVVNLIQNVALSVLESSTIEVSKKLKPATKNEKQCC